MIHSNDVFRHATRPLQVLVLCHFYALLFNPTMAQEFRLKHVLCDSNKLPNQMQHFYKFIT